MIVILILFGLSCGFLGNIIAKTVFIDKLKQMKNLADYYADLYDNLCSKHYKLKTSQLSSTTSLNTQTFKIEQAKKYKVVFKKSKSISDQVYIRLDYASNGLNFLRSETYVNKQFALDKALELVSVLNCPFVNETNVKKKVYKRPTGNKNDIIVGEI